MRAFRSTILFIALCYCLGITVTNLESFSRALMIGDSIDRFAVVDWCIQQDGIICEPNREPDFLRNEDNFPTDDYIVKNKRLCNSFLFGTNKTFTEVFSSLKFVYTRVCYDLRNKVVLGFLFNHLGVRTKRHCLAHHNSDLIKSSDEHMEHSTFIGLTILPAVLKLKVVMGGGFHGVSIHSGFWDVSREHECMRKGYFEIKSEDKLKWILGWMHDAGKLIAAIKSSVICTNVTWIGWRTANDIIPCYKNQGWNTVDARNILKSMNLGIPMVADALGIELINYDKFEPLDIRKMRDSIHPYNFTSVRLASTVINRTLGGK